MTNVRNKGRKRPDANPFQLRWLEQQKDEEGSALKSMVSPPPPHCWPIPCAQGASQCSHHRLCIPLDILYLSQFWTFVHIDASYHSPVIHMGLAITSVLRARRLTIPPVRFWVSPVPTPAPGSPNTLCTPPLHPPLTQWVVLPSVKTAGNTFLEGRELFCLSLRQTIQHSTS